MFWSKAKPEEVELTDAIRMVHTRMKVVGPDSEEYTKPIAHLESLMEMKSQSRSTRPSADTVLAVAGNIVGILVIVAYEREHVLASKAINFVMKAKI